MCSNALVPAPCGMFIRVNRKRVSFGQACSEADIFARVNGKLVWPKNRAFFEFQDDRMVEILNESELRLACRILSECMYNESRDWVDEIRVIERKVEQHMAEPDSEPDEKVCSDDDMTMEDFYMMGFRHEICN